MPKREPQPLADGIHELAAAELEKYLAGDARFEEACLCARQLSKVRWYREMLDELTNMQLSLPLSPSREVPVDQQARAATQRVILFLRNARIYEDDTGPFARALGWGVGIGLLSGFVLLLVFGLIAFFFEPGPWINTAFTATAILMGGCLLPVLVTHVLGLVLAAVIIFRVRVLRQDLTPGEFDDIWPYVEAADYRADLARQSR